MRYHKMIVQSFLGQIIFFFCKISASKCLTAFKCILVITIKYYTNKYYISNNFYITIWHTYIDEMFFEKMLSLYIFAHWMSGHKTFFFRNRAKVRIYLIVM